MKFLFWWLVILQTVASTQELFLTQNGIRAIHKTPPFNYSTNLAQQAQKWADQLQQQKQLSHNQIGQNIAWSGGSNWPAYKAVCLWYSERKSYDVNNPQSAGHFTQMLWKSSTKVGCGVSRGDYGTVVVCNYEPAGNVANAFANNVNTNKIC